MPDSLVALRHAFKQHGVVLLPRTSGDIRPGVVLNHRYEVVDHLSDLRENGKSFFSSVGVVSLGDPTPASFVVDEVTGTTSGGGHVGANFMKIASVKAAAAASSEVSIRFGPLSIVRVRAGLDAFGKPAFLEGADYCSLLTSNLKWAPFKVLAGEMRKHALGLPALFPRRLEIAEALVYAESVEFKFKRASGVDFEAAVSPYQNLDIQAGFQITTTKEGTVSWRNGSAMPVGFIPVRYVFRERDDTFIPAME